MVPCTVLLIEKLYNPKLLQAPFLTLSLVSLNRNFDLRNFSCFAVCTRLTSDVSLAMRSQITKHSPYTTLYSAGVANGICQKKFDSPKWQHFSLRSLDNLLEENGH